MKQKPVVLVIRDGWGENHQPAHDSFNAVKLARTPVAHRLRQEWPRTEIAAHGLDVGLPEGVMGNSEVGHQNIGAGRIVDQEIVRIDKAMTSGAIARNPVLQAAIANARKNGGALHFFGLISDAGVHSMLRHLFGMLAVVKDCGLERVFIQAFTDGRDTPPKSGLNFLRELESECARIGVGQVASVSGRFWAMDRDNRWERVQRAYDALTGRRIERTAASAIEAIEYYYAHPLDASRQGDEFIVPTVVTDKEGRQLGRVQDGDSVIFFNFRGDRPRELTRAFIEKDFQGFERGPQLALYYAIMTNYQEGLCANILFDKPPKMDSILGDFVAQNGIAQFRCAETEKFPHVTFFFNDYRESPFPGEEREIVPSPKTLPDGSPLSTYDQMPEMSAYGVCAATVRAIESGKYGLVVVNFANGDMVGHTGSLPAAIRACEVVDECLGRILEAVDRVGGKAVVTADHGNADQMFDPSANCPHTQHTLNPVEVILYGEGCRNLRLQESGRLADIAPTVLALMGLPQPAAMTGNNLIR